MTISKTYKNTATIASNALWVIDPLNEVGGGAGKDYMKKYTPFDTLFVSNEDPQTIEVYPNGSTDRKFVLPQGATRNGIDEQFSHLIVKNIGSGTVAINGVVVRIGKVAAQPAVRKK